MTQRKIIGSDDAGTGAEANNRRQSPITALSGAPHG